MVEGKSYEITNISDRTTYQIINITKEKIKELDKRDIIYKEI